MKKVIVFQYKYSNELVENFVLLRMSLHFSSHAGQSNKVLELLKNRHLRTMIKALDRSINPADDMQKAMIEPIFVQFVDQLLLIVENKETK